VQVCLILKDHWVFNSLTLRHFNFNPMRYWPTGNL